MPAYFERWTGRKLEPYYDPLNALVHHVNLPVGYYPMGTVLGQYTAQTKANQVQTVTTTGTPTGGSFRLVFDGVVSAPIAFDATAAIADAILEAMPNIGVGNVTTAGGPQPGTALTVTFVGDLAGQNHPIMSAITSFTGGSSPATAVTITTAGNPGGLYFGPYADADVAGLSIARALLQYDTLVTPAGFYSTGVRYGPSRATSAPAYFAGTFACADLVGLDANGAADLGKLIQGTYLTGILRIG